MLLKRGFVVAAVVVLFAAVVTPVAQAASPLGMERFVVSVGKASSGSRANWVRLGSYSFHATDNTVTETHWHWTQSRRESRSSTGVRAAHCVARDCVVRTAHGFQSSSAPRSLSGTYTVTGSVVRISWAGNGWEEWNLSEPVAGKSGSPFWMRTWDPCDSARCLGGLNTSSQTSYYLAMASTTSTGRRDTLEHWRHSLADGRDEHCYTGNSHVKPMLQIIDSDGGFHGWVGVEASLNQTVPSQGTSGDDIGVFVLANH